MLSSASWYLLKLVQNEIKSAVPLPTSSFSTFSFVISFLWKRVWKLVGRLPYGKGTVCTKFRRGFFSFPDHVWTTIAPVPIFPDNPFLFLLLSFHSNGYVANVFPNWLIQYCMCLLLFVNVIIILERYLSILQSLVYSRFFWIPFHISLFFCHSCLACWLIVFVFTKMVVVMTASVIYRYWFIMCNPFQLRLLLTTNCFYIHFLVYWIILRSFTSLWFPCLQHFLVF